MKTPLNQKLLIVGAVAVGFFTVMPSVSALSLTITTPPVSDLLVTDQDSLLDFDPRPGTVNIYSPSLELNASGFTTLDVTGDNTGVGRDLSVLAIANPSGGTVKARLEDSITLNGPTEFKTSPTTQDGSTYALNAWLKSAIGDLIPLFSPTSAGTSYYIGSGLTSGDYTLILEAEITVPASGMGYVNFIVESTSVPDGGGTLALLGFGSLALGVLNRKKN